MDDHIQLLLLLFKFLDVDRRYSVETLTIVVGVVAPSPLRGWMWSCIMLGRFGTRFVFLLRGSADYLATSLFISVALGDVNQVCVQALLHDFSSFVGNFSDFLSLSEYIIFIILILLPIRIVY